MKLIPFLTRRDPKVTRLAELMSTGKRPATNLPAPLVETKKARAALVIDHTLSRSKTLEAAIPLTDALLSSMSDQLLVSLAGFGGRKMPTFTGFEENIEPLRKMAARLECIGGETQIIPVLKHYLNSPPAQTVTVITDSFEEAEDDGIAAAQEMKKAGMRLIVLFEYESKGTCNPRAPSILGRMCEITEGAILPFNNDLLRAMKSVMGAIGVLSVGGVALLESKRAEPGAALLLEHLSRKKRK